MAAMPQTLMPTHRGLDVSIAEALAAHAGEALSDPVATVRRLIALGLDRLPLPGHGATLKRWQCLAQVGRASLALAKLYESHVDALAILHEIDTRHKPRPDTLYAVWASESPKAPLRVRSADSGMRLDETSFVVVDGCKAWCSGAKDVDVALVTLTDADGGRWLGEIAMRQPGIDLIDDRWNAVGMRDSGTAEIVFDGVSARIVGHRNAYLERPGFWHGGAGVAACWFGAATEIGARVRDLQVGRDDVHALAHLGAIDATLASNAALLREVAAGIDQRPAGDSRHAALRARAAIADGCERVLKDAAHALGPGPLCSEARLSRHFADLPVFIRQMRGGHDLVAQARALLGSGAGDAVDDATDWAL